MSERGKEGKGVCGGFYIFSNRFEYVLTFVSILS